MATVPAGITGVLLQEVLASDDKIWLTAVALAVFGVVLAAADRLGGERDVDSFQLRDAIAMGVGQALALQPGVSRSGITITVARVLKFDRVNAARLSFLMSLPIIAGAGLFKYLDIGGIDGIPADMKGAFAAGMIASAVTGFLAVWGLDQARSQGHLQRFRDLPRHRRYRCPHPPRRPVGTSRPTQRVPGTRPFRRDAYLVHVRSKGRVLADKGDGDRA